MGWIDTSPLTGGMLTEQTSQDAVVSPTFTLMVEALRHRWLANIMLSGVLCGGATQRDVR
ncbi:hypothetical protein ASG62_22920 [Aureimonas sp. Leaf427]|nr:hypothetical protein ASG62_22920 [Aureimonas sp. Leaf427]